MTTTAARAAALALLICTCAPSSANADFLVEPFFAWTRNSETSRTVPGGGVAAEWASGWLLVGGDFGYGAGFFDPAEDVLDLIASSHVLTAGGHVGIGMPPERGGRFAPYFTGGFGWMRQSARDREGLIDVVRNDPSLNFGGGVRMLLNDYLGVRGDIRYFRSMRDPFDEPDPIVADLDRLHFWRFSLGAVLRFGWE
jgi:hypothetical protein